MADDIKAENYKKSVEKIADIWGKEMDKLAKQLSPIIAELGKLEAIKDPGPDDTKRIDDLTKKRADIRKQIEAATFDFNQNLLNIQDPIKADEKECLKVPPWFKEI